MIRRFGSGRLSSRKKTEEEINPMDGVGNMADAMLILAVGIMLALIMNWNVDISGSQAPVEVDQAKEVTDVENISGEDLDEAASSSGLSELGKVYQDPETGKMYMIVEEE